MMGSKFRLFCSTCNQEFMTSGELNRHMTSRHSNPLPTDMTSQTTAQALRNNNLTIPAEDLIVQQAQNAPPPWTTEQQTVQASISGPTPTPEVLPVTSASTSNKVLTIPIERSKQNRNGKHDILAENCTECSMSFSSGVDLRKHIDLAHKGRQGGKKYQCFICAKEFDDKAEHKDHVDLHAFDKPFRCDTCGLHVTNSACLKRHIKRVHEKCKQAYECPECGKGFYERHDLARHARIHKIPKCELCGKTLNGANRKKHNCKPKIAENEELKCKICGAQLETKVAWGAHMWKHTKDPSYIQIETEPEVKVKPEVQAKVKKVKRKEVVKKPQARTSAATPTTSAAGSGFPVAPEAHVATSYRVMAQQPLCLQTTSRAAEEEEPVKPLNMQIANPGKVLS